MLICAGQRSPPLHIAVNTRLMMPDRLEGIGMVTHEVMRRIVATHPGDRFDYYFDRPSDPAFHHGPNVSSHVFYPPTRLPVLIRYWLDGPVKRHILRQGADVFFSPDGFVPIRLQVPKVAMVHDVAFLRFPGHLPGRIRRFYKTWMPRFVKAADHVVTVSEFSRREILDAYDLPPEKVSVVLNGCSADYRPLSPEERQAARDHYAEGRPYFVFLGAIHPRKNLLTLVQGFEHFLRETGEDVRLVIAGRPSWHTGDFFDRLEKSPFRSKINLPGYVPTLEATRLVGGSEAMVYPSWYEGFGLPLLEAMAAGVPVISADAASLPEVAGDAALLFDPSDAEALAEGLRRVCSEQDLRQDLIRKGHLRREQFSWDTAAGQLYGILARAAGRG